MPVQKYELNIPTEKPTVHLAHCYIGQTTRRAIDTFTKVLIMRNGEGPDFPHDETYGNEAVQQGTRELIAKLLNVDPNEITLTFNTNHSLQIIKLGLSTEQALKVALVEGEYLDLQTPFLNHNKIPKVLRGTKILISCKKDSKGRPVGFDLKELEKTIKAEKPKLLVLSHVQFTSGFPADLSEISKICKKNNVYFAVDVAQSLGVLPLDFKEIEADAVFGPLWKWTGGLRGNGFLYTKAKFRDDLGIGLPSATGLLNVDSWLPNLDILDFSGDGKRYEPSTIGTEGLCITREMLETHGNVPIDQIRDEVFRLHGIVKENLTSKNIKIYMPENREPGSFVAFTLCEAAEGKETDLLNKLKKFNSSTTNERIRITNRGGFFRIAPHYFTNEEALIYACLKINSLADSYYY